MSTETRSAELLIKLSVPSPFFIALIEAIRAFKTDKNMWTDFFFYYRYSDVGSL